MKEFNEEEINVLRDITEEWLSEGFIGKSSFTDTHYSIIEKLGIKKDS